MDAKESGEEPEDESEKKDAAPAAAPLPATVERALARARAAAKADHERKAGRWLALIPLGVGALLLLLLMPQSTRPDGVPIPRVDRRATTAIAKADEAFANEAEEQRLPGDTLSLGTVIRDFNVAEGADDVTGAAAARSRAELLANAMGQRKDGDRDLLKLRAAQTRAFLAAIAAWEAGNEPKDFVAAGGSFVKRAEQAGWVKDRHVLLDETQRRVAFKTVWNALTHLDRQPFALTLDEERALYAFYIQHPRPPENSRRNVEDMLQAAKTSETCARAQAERRRQEESWRADKIKRLGAIDPTYPTDYALGVVYFRGGRSDLAVESFTSFLEAHPDGAYSIRARNHLKAALAGVEP